MISDEAVAPYERPPLSKEFLRSTRSAESLGVLPVDWYRENDVELIDGRAVSLNPDERAVQVAGGNNIRYSNLVLATGGRPRRLDWHDPQGRILYLRSLQDARALKEALGPGRRIVIIGAGFIGGEVAASARHLGASVTIVEALPLPLARVLDEDIAGMYADLHGENGVNLRLSSQVVAVRAGSDLELTLHDGNVLNCDVVLIGIGLEPNVNLAVDAGLECRNGIVVDEFGRSSADGIFAAGDVANHFNPVYQRWLRVEHHDNALKQGAIVAANILGDRRPYEAPHWFWSVQYDCTLEAVGWWQEHDQAVTRGTLESRRFVRFYLKAGQIVGAVGLNAGRDVRRAGRLVGSRMRIEAVNLADEAWDLRRALVATPIGGIE